MLQDLRYGFRMLIQNPGFSVVAIITLALGIGANSAIFSVVNSILLRPLSYQDPDRLVLINHDYRKIDLKASVSVPGYAHYRDNASSFEKMGALGAWGVNITGEGEPERLAGMVVTWTLFPTLGADAAKGRVFLPEEDQPGRNREVVISDSLWHRRFAADPNIIGKSLVLNGDSYQVVGVMPASFRLGAEYGNPADIFAPIAFTPNQLDIKNITNEFLVAVGRLKPGVTVEQAQAEMDKIAGNLREQTMPGMGPQEWGLLLTPLHEEVVGDIRPALLVLLAAVGFVLLIACANVANLLLSRAAVRQKEMALRAALGAGRLRIVRQLLTESILLSVIGGTLGLLIAQWGVRLMVTLNENNIPRSTEIGLDSRVLIFTVAVSILTGILFGLVPALHFSKTDLHSSLKEGGRSVVSDSRKRLRSALVIAEMALALVLLISAGLMIKSFRRLHEVNPGFNPQNLLAMQLSLPRNKYDEPAQMNAFYGQAIEQISALPGVQSAGFTSVLPLSGNNESGSFYIEHHDVPQGQQPPHGDRWRVTSGYMQTMNIPLIRGRYFAESDNTDAQGVAIVDEMLAKKYWPNEDPIGQRITFEGGRANPRYREVVGIVGHVKHSGLDGESRAQYYIPIVQNQSRGLYLAVRTSNDPASLTPAIRGVFKNLDPDLPVYKVTTMERLVSDSMARQRFSVVLLGTFAGVALLLAAIGIYGVMAYSVSQRTSEIGIRMALGAQARDVLKLVISHGMLLIGIGLAIGITVSAISTRLMSSLLFGVSSTDPAIFVLISATLAGVALLACYIPARRATRVDPMMALRDE